MKEILVIKRRINMKKIGSSQETHWMWKLDGWIKMKNSHYKQFALND